MKTNTNTSKTYKTHREGSCKGRIHQLYDVEGREAAWVLSRRLKLAEATLTWFGHWALRKVAAPTVKAEPKSKALGYGVREV